jgi:hypothetical protein
VKILNRPAAVISFSITNYELKIYEFVSGNRRNKTFATEKLGRRFVKRVSQKTCQIK